MPRCVGFSSVCFDVGASVLCASMCRLQFWVPRCVGFSSVCLDVCASVLCASVGFCSVCLFSVPQCAGLVLCASM